MNNLRLILTCTLLVLLFGCQGGTKHKIAITPHVVNIVLCDLTRSIDTTSIDSIAAHAGLLYRCSPRHSSWYYYGIGATDYNCRLGEYDNEKTGRMSRAEMAERDSTLGVCADSICCHIREAYHEFGYKQTCITSALKTVYDKVKDRRQAGDTAEVNLIILSDLVEECENSPFGGLWFNTHNNYQESMKRMDTISVSPFDLRVLDVNIYVVPESKNEHTHVSRSEMEDAWRKIFKRYGYVAGDDPRLSFTGLNSLPDKLLGKRK